MKNYFGWGIRLASLSLLLCPIFSDTSIILYPTTHALITSKAKFSKISEKTTVVYGLPRGLIPAYFSVNAPEAALLELRGIQPIDFYDALIGKKVTIANQDYEFLGTTPDHIVVKSGEKTLFFSKNTPLQSSEKSVTNLRQATVYGVVPTDMTWSGVVDTLPSQMTYVLTLGPIYSFLNAAVQIQNQTDMTFDHAKIEIKVGGRLFETGGGSPHPMAMMKMAQMDASSVVTAGDVQFYYSVPGTVSLPADATVVVPVFQTNRLRPQTIYRLDCSRFNPDTPELQLQRQLLCKNNSGYPLAAGTVQIMSDQRLVAVGTLPETGAEGDLRIPYGNAIDVMGTRKVVSTNTVDHIRTETIEINIINGSSKLAPVEVVETYWGNWEVVRASQGYRRAGSNQIIFEPRLGPKTAETITVTVKFVQ